MNLENIALITMLSLFVLEVLRGTYAHSKVSLNDWVINVISLAQENLIRPLFALALATAAGRHRQRCISGAFITGSSRTGRRAPDAVGGGRHARGARLKARARRSVVDGRSRQWQTGVNAYRAQKN